MKKRSYLRKYKRYTNLSFFDRFLNYLDYLVTRYGQKFCIIAGLYLLIIVLIDILS